jgi:arsenite-transporting ATPase
MGELAEAYFGGRSGLFARKLLLVTGKGGIGKTLIAASLGQTAAEAGRRVLIVENATTDQVPPLFGFAPVGHQTLKISQGLECINLNADANFRDYVVKHLGQKRLFDTVLSHKVVQSFIAMIPGLAQLMILGRLFYECELAPEPRYDLVIFDAPASGHFMSLMTTPDAVLSSNLGGPLRRETERVKAFLGDRAKVGMIYVSTPEELVVSETLDFLPRLEANAPVEISALLVNRMPMWCPGVLEDARDGAARTYALRQHRTAELSLSMLKAGLSEKGEKLGSVPLTLLPDLGAIAEPLSAGFSRHFLGDASDIVMKGGSQ